MKRLIVGLLLLSMVGAASADGHWDTCGNFFQFWKAFEKENKNPTELWQAADFMGYVSGWVDADKVHNKKGINFPTGFTKGQAIQIVGNWLERNPALWHRHRGKCVYWALREAYGVK